MPAGAPARTAGRTEGHGLDSAPRSREIPRTMPIAPFLRPAGRPRRAGLLVALAAVVTAACMTDAPTTTRQPSSHLRFLQLIPNAPALDVFVDTSRVFQGVGYRFVSGFTETGSGNLRVRFRSGGGTDVVDLTHPVEFPRAYTVLATGLVGSVEGFVVPDTAAIPAGGEIALRFIQGSPAAGTVDVYVTDPTASLTGLTPTFAGVPFRGVRDYETFAAGRYRFRVTQAGTTTVLFDLTQTFADRAMRTLVTTDTAGGGTPIAGLVLIDL